MNTLDYYNKNASEFVKGTIGADFTETQSRFAALFEKGAYILDFGCGYGPIGIYIKKNCDCNVDMVDVNKRAINLALKNAKMNMVNVNIFESDIYSNIGKKYDSIITNPPVRVGKKILYEILFQAKDYLKEDGSLYLVINKDQGAKSLKKDLEECYRVTTIKKNKGFYVFKCQIR